MGLAPISFICCILLLTDGEINTAGLPIYGFLIFAFAIPIGALNSFIVAPVLAARYTPKTRIWVPAAVHLGGFIASILGLWLCLQFMETFIGIFGQFGFIVGVTWYLAVFFLVPVVAGSFVYSYSDILHLHSGLSTNQEELPSEVSASQWPDY